MLRRIAFALLLLLSLLTLNSVFAQDEASTETLVSELEGIEPQFEVLEEIVNFENVGQEIVGTLTTPDSDTPAPVVLLFHGFMSVRDELPVMNTDEGMFARTARILAEQGIASLRIDFRGSGESEGAWADTTFSGQTADALAAIDYLETLDTVDSSRIGVLGLSQGGLVAASAAARDSRVKTAILWSAVANPSTSYPGIFGTDVVEDVLANGDPVDYTMPWGASATLNQPFFEEIYTTDPIAEITNYEGPLLVVVGLRDDLVAPQPFMGELYTRYHTGENILVEVDGDHTFDVLTTGPEKLDEVIYWSLAWLQQTL